MKNPIRGKKNAIALNAPTNRKQNNTMQQQRNSNDKTN